MSQQVPGYREAPVCLRRQFRMLHQMQPFPKRVNVVGSSLSSQ